jgi:hypothetical protein
LYKEIHNQPKRTSIPENTPIYKRSTSQKSLNCEKQTILKGRPLGSR